MVTEGERWPELVPFVYAVGEGAESSNLQLMSPDSIRRDGLAEGVVKFAAEFGSKDRIPCFQAWDAG